MSLIVFAGIPQGQPSRSHIILYHLHKPSMDHLKMVESMGSNYTGVTAPLESLPTFVD